MKIYIKYDDTTNTDTNVSPTNPLELTETLCDKCQLFAKNNGSQ